MEENTTKLVHYVVHINNWDFITTQIPSRPLGEIIEEFDFNQVEHRDISEVVLPRWWDERGVGNQYIGFKFFDRYEAIILGGEKIIGRVRNLSPMYFVGEPISIEKILEDKDIEEVMRRLFSRHSSDRTLVKLASCNHEYYFLSEDDIIVPKDKLKIRKE